MPLGSKLAHPGPFCQVWSQSVHKPWSRQTEGQIQIIVWCWKMKCTSEYWISKSLQISIPPSQCNNVTRCAKFQNPKGYSIWKGSGGGVWRVEKKMLRGGLGKHCGVVRKADVRHPHHYLFKWNSPNILCLNDTYILYKKTFPTNDFLVKDIPSQG